MERRTTTNDDERRATSDDDVGFPPGVAFVFGSTLRVRPFVGWRRRRTDGRRLPPPPSPWSTAFTWQAGRPSDRARTSCSSSSFPSNRPTPPFPPPSPVAAAPLTSGSMKLGRGGRQWRTAPSVRPSVRRPGARGSTGRLVSLFSSSAAAHDSPPFSPPFPESLTQPVPTPASQSVVRQTSRPARRGRTGRGQGEGRGRGGVGGDQADKVDIDVTELPRMT